MQFSIEDIHRIREADYEATKHLSPDELIARTDQNAQWLLQRLDQAGGKPEAIHTVKDKNCFMPL